MHLKRWLTAIVLLPLLLLLLLKGSKAGFTFFVCLVSFLSLEEFFTITANHILPVSSPDKKPDKKEEEQGLCTTVIPLSIRSIAHLMSFSLIIAAHSGSFPMMLSVPALNLMLISLILFRRYDLDTHILDVVKNQLAGLIYISLFLSIIVLIRNSPQGEIWIIWLLIIIAGSDTGAFYVGSYFGKTPLAARVSPNKTLEGALGGIFTAVVLGVIFDLIFIDGISIGLVIPFAMIAAVLGQIGDLFESVLKRAGTIKDSGSILPGHGGLLDRIDGLLFAAPVVYIFKEIIL